MLFICLLKLFIFIKIIISNDSYPSCKKCIYYKPSFFDSYNFGECTKFSKRDNKTDILLQSYTHRCRDNENECGKSGKFFIRKLTLF